MRKTPLTILLLATLALPLSPLRVTAESFQPNYLISDDDMTDVFSMGLNEIQTMLDRGYLGTYVTEDVDGKRHYASDIIWRAAQRNGISPRVILVMLQKEQSLVTDPSPTEDQLNWAMGYGVCDNCTHDDPAIQRFSGFAKQVNSATLQLSQGYLADLTAIGETIMGFSPGDPIEIDGTTIVPANNATAALYTYTPHLHGNENFVTLWHRWFSLAFPTGSLLQNTTDGGVWLIQYGKRRPITSRAAFETRFNDASIIPVSQTELEAYPMGTPITLPNYSLLQNGPDIYLLVDDTVRHITSMEAFRAIGYSSDEIVPVTDEELAGYARGESITDSTVYPQGALLQDPTTGGVYFVQNGLKHPIMSREILTARFSGKPIIPAGAEELDSYETSDPVLFPDGALIGVTGEPAVYFVSEGMRRPILNGAVFEGFGWKWENVLWTNEKSVTILPVGEPLQDVHTVDDSDIQTSSLP